MAKNQFNLEKKLKGKLGNAFYSLITVANYFDVDLEESLNITIKKYEKKSYKTCSGK